MQARFNLLSLCGLPLEQELQPPPAASADSLRLRAALVSAGKAVLKTDPSLVLAERALERANEDAKRLPGIVSGMCLRSGLCGRATCVHWLAGLW